MGFRAAFLAYGACAAISVPLGFSGYEAAAPRVAKPPPESYGKRARLSLAEWLGQLASLFKQIQPALRATYLVIVFATFTSFVHRVTLQSMLPLYASELGFTPSQTGLLFTIMGMFVLVMILPAGFVIDKVGRKWASVPSTGIPALVFVLIPFSDSFFELAVLFSLMGVANGLSLGSLATSTYDVVPAIVRGRLQAVRRTLAEIGGVCAPLLGGFFADTFGPEVPFLVYAPLLVLSAVLLAVIGRETLKR
jgi:MFS family permease